MNKRKIMYVVFGALLIPSIVLYLNYNQSEEQKSLQTTSNVTQTKLSQKRDFVEYESKVDLLPTSQLQAQVDFSGADLSGEDFSGEDLRGADLSETNLSETNLSEADLRGADLSGADLSEVDLSGADLRGADFRGAIFDETVMPDGTTCNTDCR